LAVIEQDRAELVAEAESALDIRRDG